jgi:heme-degrading monooxygenase HmoA
MLKHVVVCKFKKGVAESDIAEMEKGLAGLPAIISEIKEFKFGRDVLRSERSYDFALVSEFENLEALKRYLVHPAHKEVAMKLRGISDSSVLVDFEL